MPCLEFFGKMLFNEVYIAHMINMLKWYHYGGVVATLGTAGKEVMQDDG